MAVTLTTDALIQPYGELSPVLFPDGDILTLTDGWLLDATARVTAATGIALAYQNAAAAAWVYYRAYLAIALRQAMEPQIVTVGPRTENQGANPSKFFNDLANDRLELYYSYNVVTPVALIPAFFGTVKAHHWQPGLDL